ncbi:major facilitator superfamily protein [Hirsutella rhossiliensis]|uniref:Major facilitator superfamily domain-containing protein n=1 Tax=Hirsutella rhossiliensis TaxID=111463 RepID=A0A9P8MSH6_9HYPO|nr:major facilitator superfamily domain-containing protein [Hirsutella rhossiliensis]KAH0958392.1 major facilitator superfamily domain-containing protein [Hirsutella rhossiliensis]
MRFYILALLPLAYSSIIRIPLNRPSSFNADYYRHRMMEWRGTEQWLPPARKRPSRISKKPRSDTTAVDEDKPKAAPEFGDKVVQLYSAAFPRSNSLVLVVVCAAVFTDIYLYGLLEPVLPFTLPSGLGHRKAEWQNGRHIARSVLPRPLSREPHLRPLRRLHVLATAAFLIGLLALAAATLLLCLSKTMALIAVGPVLQGVSAATCWEIGLALLADTTKDRMGWASGGAGEWKGDELVGNTGASFTPETPADNENRRDTRGDKAGHVAASEASARTSLPTTSGTGWKTSPCVSLVKSRRLFAALAGCIMQSASKFALCAASPPFVQETFHWSSLAAGLVLLCIFLPGFFSPVIVAMTDRYGTQWLTFAGFILSIPLLDCLRFRVALSLSSTPLMAETTYVSEAEEKRQLGVWGVKCVYGAGFGLFTTSFALGGVIGSVIAGYLYQSPGWNTFGWAFAVWCAGGAIINALFVRKPFPESKVVQ